ncbi:DUF4367 domain-containing protein [Gracilibacillus sp. YIM 98692]|uniref:DUF4367 domain-containing protein n=1 Tax=Gracilibacillus sp. YIM 98692 TaxID=2663532 RepID=UPI0013D3ADF4|nr:DUF4367 domain-containing protein [Gracilibacillus sp. YIM 98692]
MTHSSKDQTEENWLREYYDNVEEPIKTKEETWSHIVSQTGIKKQSRPSWIKQKGLIAVAILALFAVGSLFMKEDQIQAFSWFTKYFVTTEGEVTQISEIQGDPPAVKKQLLPTEADIHVRNSTKSHEVSTFAEAQEITEVDLSRPDYMPEDLQLERVTIYYDQDKTRKVQSLYQNEQERQLVIIQKPASQGLGYSKIVDNQDTEIETLTIQGEKATLLTYKDGWLQLRWKSELNQWVVEGSYSEEQIVEVAQSIR